MPKIGILKFRMGIDVYAQNGGVDIGRTFPIAVNNPAFSSVGGFVSFFVPIFLLVGGIFCFFIVVITGFGVISNAGGDPHAAENRKMILTYAMIGLIIMFASFWILQILNNLTGKPFGGVFG